jgi:hypothetical protein
MRVRVKKDNHKATHISDKEQAQLRIGGLVRRGKIPPATAHPCAYPGWNQATLPEMATLHLKLGLA